MDRKGLLPVALLGLITLVGILRQPQRQAEMLPDLSAYPWVYLRDDRTLEAGENLVELIAVGDVMLGREAAEEAGVLDAAAPWLQAADLALGNLECVITADQPPSADGGNDHPYWLYAPLMAVDSLEAAGFDLLSLANNHTMDHGPGGLAETAARLQEAGIASIGVGSNSKQAYQPVIRQINELRLAFLAFNGVSSPPGSRVAGMSTSGSGWQTAGWDPQRAVEVIRSAREQADVVVVSVHWGYEYQLWGDPAQRQAAQALFAAGADLLIGHHPHVVQELEHFSQPDVRAAGLAAYSLGNFVFDQGFAETQRGLALRVFFDNKGLRAVQALPVVAGPHPYLAPPAQAEEFALEFLSPQEGTAFACNSRGCQPVEAPPDPPSSGIFWGGEIDLTGDQIPERIRRQAGQVIIYQDGGEAWRSPDEWQVVDLAMGDPNQDGRNELFLALLRPDADGVLRSHPFIIGYRGGSYQELWGGSAVGEPILEVELGDVDGDGLQELIVLEDRQTEGGQAIAVWRWHGWGFSLFWRSPAERYEGLSLFPAEGKASAFTSSNKPPPPHHPP